MNVTPSSPLLASFGLCVCPVRTVTAESCTRRPKARARLRRTGLLRLAFNINRLQISPGSATTAVRVRKSQVLQELLFGWTGPTRAWLPRLYANFAQIA